MSPEARGPAGVLAGRLAGNHGGIAAMVVAMLALTLNFALVKQAGETLPLGEIICLRGLAAALLVGAVVVATGRHREIRLVFHRAVLWRTACETASAIIFFVAVLQMPIANATIVLQALPLVITAAAALLLGERVRPERWAAILVGFIGVVMVVQPGVAEHGPASLLVVLAVLLTATRDLVTRMMPAVIPTLLVAAAALVSQSLVGFSFALFEQWVWPDARALILLGGASTLFCLGLCSLILATRLGDVSAVAPFRYSSIVWAILLDYALWGVVVGPAVVLGSIVIILSGLYISYSARRRGPGGRAGAPRPE